MSLPFEVPRPSADALELLKDPRIAGMRLEVPGMSGERRILEPIDPPLPGEGRYLCFSPSSEGMLDTKVEWLNEPRGAWGTGGRGFPFITSKPHIVEAGPRVDKLHDAWRYSSWIVASSRFADIVKRFEPDVVQTIEIDWVFSDGKKLDGYVFLDICRVVDAYDYRRSDVLVEAGKKSIFITGLGNRRSLRPSLDQSFHAFRDVFLRQDFFMSRELAQAIMSAGMHGVQFRDPATMSLVEF